MAGLVDNLSDSYLVIEIEFEKQFRAIIDSNPNHWEKQRNKLNHVHEKAGIYFSAHAPYIGINTDIANKDEVIRISAVDYIRRYIVKASEIGVKIITLHPGYIEYNQNGVRDFDFCQLTKSLESLAAIATDFGISILLENTGNDREKYILLSDEQHNYISNECNIGLTLDLVHFHSFYHQLNTESYLKKLKSIIPNVCNAHFNDVLNGKHVHLPLRYGNFNFHQVLTFMQEEGYQGNFIIEESGGGFTPDTFVQAGRDYVKHLNSAL